MSDQLNIGLIGIGLLGLAIAERLGTQGQRVLAFDIDTNRRQKLTPPHAAVDDAQQVVKHCSTIVLSLPTSQIASEVVHSLKLPSDKETLIIDTTTGSPAEMVQLAQFVRDQGCEYAEATVAGSSQQMRSGEATLFLGCSDSSRKRTQETIDLLAKKSFYLGEVGAASRFKLVHNLVLGLNRAVLAEGLVFGQAMGFDAATTLQVLTETPAYSQVMSTKGTKMVDRNYDLQARLSQHLKDVRLILGEAEKLGVPTPMSRTHRELLEHAEQLGYGDSDNSAVIEAFRGKPPQQPVAE